jgi:hypothetical protein
MKQEINQYNYNLEILTNLQYKTLKDKLYYENF